jgi:hypothetical protein
LKKTVNFAIVKKGNKMAVPRNRIQVGTLVLVMVLAGAFCFSIWASEPKTTNNGDTDKTAQLAVGPGNDNGSGVLEQEQTQPLAKIAKKHFPWLWVAAGAVAVGVVLYFTVFKKPEYKLNVSMGPGVSGYPVAGTFVYKKGKKVRYVYNLGYGYRALKVMLDGSEVATSGEFTMDRDHVLAVTSEEQFYDLTVTTSAGVSGTPAAGTYSYKEGTSVTYSYIAATGYDNLKVQVDGINVVAQGTLKMDRAHTLISVAKLIPPPNFDVRGTWRVLSPDFTTQEMIFVGSPATGNVYRPNNSTVIGSYLVTVNQISFSVWGMYKPEFVYFAGTIWNVNNMDGTWIRHICDGCGEFVGTWSAVRIQ